MSAPRACRAQKPSTCWKHGNGLGYVANREIKEAFSTNEQPAAGKDGKVSLKGLESKDLAVHLLHFARTLSPESAAQIKEAILLASDLHKPDTRANRGAHDKTPYIEHPLRNTLRLVRYGCTDTEVLVGSILHDTVEDHPFEIARDYAKKEPATEQEARDISYQYIQKRFGRRTASMVEGMSNPITNNAEMTTEQKNLSYHDHFVVAIKDGDVLVGKTSDFTDNALSLHHTEASMSSVSLHKKSTKYLMVIDSLIHELQTGYIKKNLPIPNESVSMILRQLSSGKQRLLEIQERHK